jgi:phosphoglycolate phosphatase
MEQATTWRPRAVLFDFDGTLADSYAAITSSVNHVRTAHGLPPLTEDQVRPHVGRGPAQLMEHVLPGIDPVRAVALYRAHHPAVMRPGTRLLPGAMDALTMLKQRGLRLAVCSNKPRIFTRELLDYLGLLPTLDAVLGPEDVARPKPAPDMLKAGLKRLDVAPTEALYVGDMTVDIETARAADVAVWVVPTGSDERSTLEDARPDRVLDSLAELPALLS